MNSIGPLFFRLRWLPWLVLLGLLVFFALLLRNIPQQPPAAASAKPAGKAPTAAPDLQFPVAKAIPPEHLTLIPQPKPLPPPRNLDDHYHLTGIILSKKSGASKSRAYLNDLKANRSKTVYAGDAFDGLTILAISNGHAIDVEFDGRRGTMAMGANRIARAPTPIARERTETVKERPLRFWERPSLSESKYGKQIEETRWVLDRRALNGYYEDITKDPIGLLQLYTSFENEKDDNTGKTTGYKLQFKGQQPFLKAVGLRENDLVRRVNGRPMTSQVLAEYFISQFRKDRMGSVVMEVERDGETKNLVYLFHDESVESDGL